MTNSSTVSEGSAIAWLTAVVMAPVLEEIVFRGLIYTRLKKGMPMMAAAVISALVFGLMHGTMIWVIYTFIFGLLLIWVYERYQSLTASILLHFAYNISGMLLSLIPAEAGVFIRILFVVCIVVAVFMYKQIMKITAVDEEAV